MYGVAFSNTYRSPAQQLSSYNTGLITSEN